MRSLRGLLDLDNTKAAKSVCPSSFFCLLYEKARCQDACCFLIKIHGLRIESDDSWMLLSASFFVEHLLDFPGHMIFLLVGRLGLISSKLGCCLLW